MYLFALAVLLLSVLKIHASKISVQSASNGKFTEYSSPGCYDYVPAPQVYLIIWTGNAISLWSEYGCQGTLIARFSEGSNGVIYSIISELGSIQIESTEAK
jgi:hypothetical protein